MRKCIALLTLALLLNAAISRAEEPACFTGSRDRYYHRDAGCDSYPDVDLETKHIVLVPYQRQAYQKHAIAEEEAVSLGKTACPVCWGDYEPVCLSESMPEWSYTSLPWELAGEEARKNGPQRCPREYALEMQETYLRFEADFDSDELRPGEPAPYPEAFGDRWCNNSGGYTYAFVEPTRELMEAFRGQYGGGAWIVPAKYSFNEMWKNMGEAVRTVHLLRIERGLDVYPGCYSLMPGGEGVDLHLCGSQWREAAKILDQTLPIYVHIAYEEEKEV